MGLDLGLFFPLFPAPLETLFLFFTQLLESVDGDDEAFYANLEPLGYNRALEPDEHADFLLRIMTPKASVCLKTERDFFQRPALLSPLSPHLASLLLQALGDFNARHAPPGTMDSCLLNQLEKSSERAEIAKGVVLMRHTEPLRVTVGVKNEVRA